MTWLGLAITACMICSVIWTAVFAFLIQKRDATLPMGTLLALHLGCLIGSFTPGNAGCEALRGLVNKKQLAMPVAQTLASSMYTSLLKLRVSLVVTGVVLIPTAVVAHPAQRLLIYYLPCLLVVVLVASFAPAMTRRFHISIPRLDVLTQLVVFVAFTAGFLIEFLAFHSCARLFELALPLHVWLSTFATLHLVAKISLLPQGLLVTEVAGYYLLAPDLASTGELLPLLGVWGLVRVTSPILLGALFTRLHHWRRR